MEKYYFRIIILLIFSINSFGKFFSQDLVYNNKISKSEAINDLNIMYQALKGIHPDLYRFTKEEDLNLIFTKLTFSIQDSIQEVELHKKIRQFVRNIGCGHTTAMPSVNWYKFQKEHFCGLAFNVYLNNNEIFFKTILDSTKLDLKGSKIISINGVASSDLVNEMISIQQRDGITNSFSNFSIEKYFTTYFMFLGQQKENYTVVYQSRNNNNIDTIVFNSLKKIPQTKPINPTLNSYYLAESTFDEFFYLSKSTNTAYLDINSFQQKDYKKFYSKIFKKIEKDSIQELFIDIRGNGGGYFPNVINLLRYFSKEDIIFNFYKLKNKSYSEEYVKYDFFSGLTRYLFSLKPDSKKEKGKRYYCFKKKGYKKQFEGTIYLLTDGGSFSLSGYLAAYLKHYSEAILIGFETGGGEIGSNAVLSPIITLPSSKIRISIPHFHIEHPVTVEKEGYGVFPKIELIRDIDLEINDQDYIYINYLEKGSN